MKNLRFLLFVGCGCSYNGVVQCIVTAGPTFEPIDEVRRLTNLSTGRLGAELAVHLSAMGHGVVLLLGEQATWHGESGNAKVMRFGTTADLSQRLQELSRDPVDAVFHAAAVSDFRPGPLWRRNAQGDLEPIPDDPGKIPSGMEGVLMELVSTPKIIASLRSWFPKALLVGWKYEVDGDRDSTLERARQQRTEHRLDATVANGPAYGEGFGVVTDTDSPLHLDSAPDLYRRLSTFQMS